MSSYRTLRQWYIAPLLLACFATAHATEFSSADYDLYAGDFNNDGKTDLLYISKTPDKPSGIALADPVTGIPQVGFQSWPSNYLNIPWSNGSYKAVVGDFNGDKCADILLQSQTPGTTYVLEANCNPANGPVGQIQGIAQAIPAGPSAQTFNLVWSADQTHLIAGDFDGDGITDLFFQATSASGTNAILLADPTGHLFTRSSNNCTTGGPQQCWTDGYQGIKWSTKSTNISVGYFDNNHTSDLLVQEKPTFVMIDYDVPFPVPKFAAGGFGIFLAQTPDSSGAIIRTPNQLWNANDLNGRWSPLNSTVVVGDFNGDGYADVLLQSRSGTNMLMLNNGSGQLQSGTALTGALASATGANYQMIVGNFSASSSPVLYLQSTTAGGTNYITGLVSSGNITTSTLQIAANATQPATGVGTTVGSASVTANGTGQYTIPLKLSPGTAGLTPELALQYQHSGKNGLLGVGWGLAGLSTITRCPQTYTQDGLTQGVQGTASDQYCLDGSRLRLTSGSQGADSSQYRTELETYSLVTAHGSTGNGPQWFSVQRKDGRTYEYGNTADSRIGAVTRVWALNKIRDRTLNYIAFSYFNNMANPVTICQEANSQGSYRPCQILYTGNSAQGTSPPYTIQFNYQGRNNSEALTHNYLGQTITEVNRLLNIQLQYGTTVVRTWTLSYDLTPTMSHASRIKTIQECGENNDCLPLTTLNWSTAQMSGDQPAFNNDGTQYLDISMLNYAYSGADATDMQVDLNGDGIPDTISWVYTAIEQPYTCSYSVQYGAPHGQPLVTGGVPVASCPMQGPQGVMDVDLDGKDDVLLQGGTYLHQKTDGTLSVDTTAMTAAASVDVDGDGYPDYVYAGSPPNNNTVYVAFRSHNGAPSYLSPVAAWTAPAGTSIVAPYWEAGNVAINWRTVIRTSDFNGDGRGDVLIQTTAGWQVLYSNGSGFTTGDLIVTKATGSGSSLTYDTPLPIDVNGDGCTDLAYPSNVANPTWQLAISKCGVTGPGFTTVDTQIQDPLDASYPQSNPSATDWNLDGNQDLLFTTTNSVSEVATSIGTTLIGPAPMTGPYLQDRDGDGLPDQMGCGPTPCVGYIQTMVGPRPDLLTSVTDGFNNTVNFTYAPLTDSSVYLRGQGQSGTTQDFSGSMYVVKQLQSPDGVGGTYNLTYAYSGAHRNIQGRGFLGFANRFVTDSRTGFVTKETYNNVVNPDGTQWQYVGTLAHSSVYQWGSGMLSTSPSYGPLVKDSDYQWNSIAPDGASNRRYPYVQTQTDKKYELNGSLVSTAVTTTSVDNYGTPTDVKVVTTENSTGINSGTSRTLETVVTTVLNDTGNWCLSKPQVWQKHASHTVNADGALVTQNINDTWDASNCRLTDHNLDVGSSWELDTHYDYDVWNNIHDQIVKATNLPQTQRMTTFDYSTSTTPGQFLMTLTNALNQQTKYTWDDARGLKRSTKDPNGFTTSWQYDDFGRPSSEARPDGTSSTKQYSPCNAATNYCGDSLLRYMVQDSELDTAGHLISYQYLFYDGVGRVKFDETLGFSGALSVVETLYDARGNVATKSTPYYAGTDSYHGTTFAYDLYNRVIQTQQANSDSDQSTVTRTTTYNGLTVTYTDPPTATGIAVSRTEVSDAWGDIVRVTDEANNNATYTYDGFSRLMSSADAANNPTRDSYTPRGFKLTSSDPDMGAWSYSYDGAGEMLTQTDAKSQQTKFHYDALGRMDNRTDPGASSPDSFFNFDTSANGIGQLASVTGPNGYSEAFSYDATAGRKVQEAVTANGTTYNVNYGYDPVLGKLQTITYPTSTWPTASQRFEVFYDYQNGYLKDVKDYTNNTPGTVFWSALAQDARGHVIQEQFGDSQQSYLTYDETNGRLNSVETGPGGGAATQNLNYSWDRVGNLLTRQDANQGLTESFQYDALYRLTNVSLNGNPTLTVSYDAIGNITNKSDVGAYNYTAAQATCSYTGLPSQPHAVRNAGGNVYCYDANGNVTSRSGSSTSWYPYNYPLTINQAGGNYSTFYYAPDRSRYRQTSLNGGTSEDRTYISGLFEKLISSAVGTEYRHYIVANNVKVGVKVVSTARNDVVYMHDDHLGSTDVIVQMNSQNQQTQLLHESYDSWGKRRGSNWTGAPGSSDLSVINTTTHIGFTGQEELDNLSLVNLNGRVYDPTIATFLSADPLVQEEYRSQSLDRYSYTWDNPLNKTDPTGFATQETCTGTRIPGPVGACQFVSSTDPQGLAAAVLGTAGPKASTAPAVQSAQTTSASPSDQQADADANQSTDASAVKGRGTWKDFFHSFGESVRDLAARAALERSIAAAQSGFLFKYADENQETLDNLPHVPSATTKMSRAGQITAKIAMVFMAFAGNARGSTGGPRFFRGARPGATPSFTPRPGEFKVNSTTGIVKDTHGVSVFNNAESVSSRGFVPHEVDQSSIPESLRIIQRGNDLQHFEIVPQPGANLTPQQFIDACSSIVCLR